jgi:hypothetical protein
MVNEAFYGVAWMWYGARVRGCCVVWCGVVWCGVVLTV